MKNLTMETNIKLIEAVEYKALYHLLEKNRTRLKRFFPITISETLTLELTKTYVEKLCGKIKSREMYSFGVYGNDLLIGMILVKSIDWRIPKCELGYYLDESLEGKGIMSRTVNEVVGYCFEILKMEKVFLRISANNLGSTKLALKNNFTLEGVLRKDFKIESGELIDVNYYGKLKNEH